MAGVWLPLDVVLEQWRPGSEDWSWAEEFADIAGDPQVPALIRSVAATTITEPLVLGDDGRVWEGHHRLLVARLLDLPAVPVTFGVT